MSDLVGNPEDRFSHNEAQIFKRHPGLWSGGNEVSPAKMCIIPFKSLYIQFKARFMDNFQGIIICIYGNSGNQSKLLFSLIRGCVVRGLSQKVIDFLNSKKS